MKKQPLSISELYAKGKEKLENAGVKWEFPLDSNYGASVQVNRKYLDSLFFVPKFFDPVDVDTSFTIFGVKLKTPVFCSPIGRGSFKMSDADLVKIARSVGKAGALMMFGIGGAKVLQGAIDTGALVVKIVKPYRNTELIYGKVRDAERRGCVAVGMDIDHFYGVLSGTKVIRTEIFGPQKTEELRQLISQTKLPFIIKGVLSITDAEKASQLGASAIIVSNHGRAAIDFTVPSMMALPNIVQSVGNKLTVLIDTGFKTGNDILKALALGARAVGFANSILLAFTADGAAGVELLVNLVTAELKRTMAATGCPNLEVINRSILSQVPRLDWLT
jgi:isopentenyl diphosphate isomerase/L-lactate dehydrogenase-like FMN-dependent dehydrogenase